MNVPTRLRALCGLVILLAACAPPYHYDRTGPAPPPAPPEQVTEVYFYPNYGQSMAQQDRDRFECYRWARQQTGFDPSAPHLVPHQRVYVAPQPPPGYDTVAGALTGAVLGAVIGAPHQSGEGAAIGAVAGGLLGAASDSARYEQSRRIEASYNRHYMDRYAETDRQARSYRRAMSACLEGRGYTVR